jgi:hypothetical protein
MLNKILRADCQGGLAEPLSGFSRVLCSHPLCGSSANSSVKRLHHTGRCLRGYTHLRDGKYSYAYFDFSGYVTVSIKSKFPLTNCRVLRHSSGSFRGSRATFWNSRWTSLRIYRLNRMDPTALYCSSPILRKKTHRTREIRT